MSDEFPPAEAIVLRYDPVGRAPRREVFVPGEDNFMRYEQTRNETGEWHTVGREAVASVTIDE